jgi:hypothetical protein
VCGAASARDKNTRQGHTKDGTPGYTLVPFSIDAYGRLGVEADKLLKDSATEAASARVGEGCIIAFDQERALFEPD